MHTTVREANDRGYDALVLSDCVGSYFPEFQRVGLEMVAAQGGIFGWVADSTALLACAPRCLTAPPIRSIAPTSASTDHAAAAAVSLTPQHRSSRHRENPMNLTGSSPRTPTVAEDPLVDPRRHQRLLRPRLQHPGQRPDADRRC